MILVLGLTGFLYNYFRAQDINSGHFGEVMSRSYYIGMCKLGNILSKSKQEPLGC